MPGPEVRSAASATTPLAISRPASAARPVLGTAPIPTTTMSAGSAAPDEVITSPTRPPGPRSSLTDSPNRNCTPCSRCRSANISPSSEPSARYSAVGSGSTTVTSQPASRAAAVISRPIQPAPTVTTRPPPRKAAASRSESPTVRRYSTPSRSAPGMFSRRGDAPVASSSRSYPMLSPSAVVTVRPAGSSEVTVTPSRRSTSCSAYQPSSCT